MGRVVIIGLDGVPYELLAWLIAKDIMPNVRSTLDDSVLRPMESTIPAISSVAWSSIITGVNPGEHGIFGFTDFDFYGRELRFPDYDCMRREPFWADVPGSIVINVPSTYPVRSIDGIHISGFVSIDLELSVYPPSMVRPLRDLGYRLDVNSSLAHVSMAAFLEDLDATLLTRIEVASDLWTRDWPLFMLVFTGTDRLLHFLWDACDDEEHQFRSEYIEHFRKIDDFIGRILRDVTPEDTLLLLSDHGFEELESEVYVNYILQSEGYLCFDSDVMRDKLNAVHDVERHLDMVDMTDSTTAFALDPGRIYVPRSLEPSRRRDILDELKVLFISLTFVDSQRPVIRNVYEVKDIYSGPCTVDGPDLVLEPMPGFDLKATLNADSAFGKRLFTGKHTRENAFLLARSPNATVPVNPTVFDIAGIVTEALRSS